MKASESLAQKRIRGREIMRRLREEFPELSCPLIHETPFQLLVATILSAQCTDERVNMVTPELFRNAPDAAAMVKLGEKKIQNLIKSINFFRNKAHNIYEMSRIVHARYDGVPPKTMEELIELPGVGRKTANVLLGNAFDKPGVVVDTHAKRLANRMGFCREEDPVKIESELEKVFPDENWLDLSHLLINHGRKTCLARKPLCGQCVVASFCPSRFKEADAWKR